MTDRKCDTCIHRKEDGCEKWECEYKERTPNRTETREFKQEFLRMASYIDCLLECSDTQKETLVNFIARLSEYIPWYEDDDFEVNEHTPERTETHACDCGKKETHGDVISRQAALDAHERIFDRCEEIEAHLPEGDPDRVGYKMYPDWMTVWKYLNLVRSEEPEQRWIPVTEWLPEESGFYICTCTDGANIRVTFFRWQKRIKCWDKTGTRAYWKVLAWMPLPEPYSERRTDDLSVEN